MGASVLACDVGTGSVRVAVFARDGGAKLSSAHVRAIRTRHERPDHYEQSTADVWRAVVAATRAARDEVGRVAFADVAGIAFDATCSLVAVDEATGAPVSVVEPGGGADGVEADVHDIVLWCDHRSVAEAERMNALDSPAVVAVRKHFGGKLSAENEPPKLAHLAAHLPPGVFARTAFFDLADWLSWKCVGGDAASAPRSSCTVACKWGWGPAGHTGWNPAFWRGIGLDGLADSTRVGRTVVPPGSFIGTLCASSAEDLGLPSKVCVGAGMIDAHAGALAMLNPHCRRGSLLEQVAPRLENRLAMVCGTSTCHIAVTHGPVFVPGVWGPYRDAVVPQFWCAEGGQSATGALVDSLLTRAAASGPLGERAAAQGKSLYALLEEMCVDLDTSDVHILPYAHGNVRLDVEWTDSSTGPGGRTPLCRLRAASQSLTSLLSQRSPRADPTLRQVIAGLSLVSKGDQTEAELALLYKATVQALALGARHIVEELNKGGHNVTAIVACGGLAKSTLFKQSLADCCRMPVFTTVEEDSVLSGAAIIASAAAAASAQGDAALLSPSLMRKMTAVNEDTIFRPRADQCDFMDRKFKVFLRMHDDFLAYRQLMRE
jgi:FGGY-family pentulose kinase